MESHLKDRPGVELTFQRASVHLVHDVKRLEESGSLCTVDIGIDVSHRCINRAR